MGRFNDRTGQRFGRLTAIRRADSRNGFVYWVCKCDCGKETTTQGLSLSNGHTRSCGCLIKENPRKHGACFGGKPNATYNVWLAMRDRCSNTNNPVFHHYGGRGIKCCERWGEYQNFLDDMGERPPGLSLDRIDNDGGYCPENCRWATKDQQSNNRRTNVFIEFNGRRMTYCQWSRETGVRQGTIRKRLINGWPVGEALFTPTQHQIRRAKLPH